MPFDSRSGWRVQTERLQDVIQTLRRQVVRQGECRQVLDCVLAQAIVLTHLAQDGVLAQAARDMKARALELQRIVNSVPKFVVEDLLEETIARLEDAQRQLNGGYKR